MKNFGVFEIEKFFISGRMTVTLNSRIRWLSQQNQSDTNRCTETTLMRGAQTWMVIAFLFESSWLPAIKNGEQADSGSDSEVSVANFPFQKRTRERERDSAWRKD